MPNLSTRFLRVTPKRIATSATIAQILAAMTAKKPNLATFSGGWGSVYDDPDLIGARGTQPPAADPEVLPAMTRGVPANQALPNPGATRVPAATPPAPAAALPAIPQTLAARLYWYKQDNRLRRESSATADPKFFYRLRAVDVLISPIDGSTDLSLMISSWNDDEVDFRVIKQLDILLRAVDSASTIGSPAVIDLIDPDFFLWLTQRHLRAIAITPDLSIETMHSVIVRSVLDHGSYLWKGVDLTRLDLIAHLADRTKSFGPARIAIRSRTLESVYDFDLQLPGAFNVLVDSTVRWDDAQLDKLSERIRIVQDLANIVIPALKDQYMADAAWNTSGRDAYRTSMKATLLTRANAL
jgi:hypothetical protein